MNPSMLSGVFLAFALSASCFAQNEAGQGAPAVPDDLLGEAEQIAKPKDPNAQLPEGITESPMEGVEAVDPKTKQEESKWEDFKKVSGPFFDRMRRGEVLSDVDRGRLEAGLSRFADTEITNLDLRDAITKGARSMLAQLKAQHASGNIGNPSHEVDPVLQAGKDHVQQTLGDLYGRMAQADLARDSNNVDALSRLGDFLVLKRDYKGAAPLLEKAVRLGARDARTFSAYGTAAFHLGDFALARTSAEQALKLDPKNDGAFAVLKLSEGKQASVSLPSVLTGRSGEGAFAPPSQGPGVSAPGGPGASGPAPARQAPAASRPQARMRPEAERKSAAFAKEAVAALAVKDYLRAIEAATRAIELNDNNAQAWNYRAMARSKLGRYEEAAKDASYALGLAPGNAATLHTRSWALNKLGRFKEGLADADSVLSREPDNAFAYQNKAFALAGLGDRKGMLEALKRSADIEPRFKARYEAALQVPDDADVLFLFDQDPGPKVAPAEDAPGRGGGRRGLVLAAVVAGGFLAALASALAFFPGLRKANGAVLQGQGEAGSFWKKYRRVREVGVGGMGVVYEAEDTSLGRRVAVKKMRDEIRLDRRERGRFLQEARTVATLKHPNIVEIYSIVEDGGEVYLVFEFADGKTLHEVLSGGSPLAFDAARRVLRDACDAVECAHRNKIVHRDIKPSNIMVAAGGSAKVMDFGVARQAKEAATKAATNTVAGTPPYMAPESEQGTVGPQSDVYGLGVVFYEMLSGKLPFAGSGAGMLLNKMNARFTPLSQAAPGLPAGIDSVMSVVLSPDPAKRYRTVGEFRAAVEDLKAA